LHCEFLEQNVQEKQHAFEMSAFSFFWTSLLCMDSVLQKPENQNPGVQVHHLAPACGRPWSQEGVEPTHLQPVATLIDFENFKAVITDAKVSTL